MPRNNARYLFLSANNADGHIDQPDIDTTDKIVGFVAHALHRGILRKKPMP